MEFPPQRIGVALPFVLERLRSLDRHHPLLGFEQAMKRIAQLELLDLRARLEQTIDRIEDDALGIWIGQGALFGAAYAAAWRAPEDGKRPLLAADCLRQQRQIRDGTGKDA